MEWTGCVGGRATMRLSTVLSARRHRLCNESLAVPHPLAYHLSVNVENRKLITETKLLLLLNQPLNTKYFLQMGSDTSNIQF